MRWIFLLVGLALCVTCVRGQEQENKLIDRLLRPDMSLTNSAQNKKFAADGSTSIDKKFVAKSFYSGNPTTTNGFQGTKNFSAKKFRSKKFPGADSAALSTARTIIPNASTKYATNGSSTVRAAREAGTTARVRDYPDQRPFLAKGKSQKALSQQDKPLTIDEVRELLNKNK